MIQLLPDLIEICFKLRRVSPVQRGIIFHLKGDGDDAQYRSRSPGQDDNPVSQTDGFRQIMSDKQGGFPGLTDDLSDVVAYCQPGLVIQCGERFIQEQKFRIQEKRPDQSGPLTHSAGEL